MSKCCCPSSSSSSSSQDIINTACCADGISPRTWILNVSGVINSGCSECTDFNSTFYLDFYSPQLVTACLWKIDITEKCLSFAGYDTIAIRVIPDINWFIAVDFGTNIGSPPTALYTGLALFLYDTGSTSPPSCCDLNNLNIPFDSQSLTSATGCDFSGATVTITPSC